MKSERSATVCRQTKLHSLGKGGIRFAGHISCRESCGLSLAGRRLLNSAAPPFVRSQRKNISSSLVNRGIGCYRNAAPRKKVQPPKRCTSILTDRNGLFGRAKSVT